MPTPTICVAGLINIETTLAVDQFPLVYAPVRYPFFGVHTSVSGVGVNIARALTVLGNEVRFASLIGGDVLGKLAIDEIQKMGIDTRHIIPSLRETPQSVILYDRDGVRQIHVDLKDIQERKYPDETFARILPGCNLAVCCNINFSRPFLSVARQAGVAVATDVHSVSELEGAYDADFMAGADILFMSHENLPCSPQEWLRLVLARYPVEIAVVGLGAGGAMIAVSRDGQVRHYPAATVRPVVNTIGAGDALFASFLHFYLRTNDPYRALQQAIIFAGYKIGARGAAEGFLSEADLLALSASLAEDLGGGNVV